MLTVSVPRRVVAGSASRVSVPCVRPVVSVRAQDKDYNPNILHEQRDALKEGVRSSNTLKEARQKLYGDENSKSDTKPAVMDGDAEKGESVLDKVTGLFHKSEGKDMTAANPQPGSRLDEKGRSISTDDHRKGISS